MCDTSLYINFNYGYLYSIKLPCLRPSKGIESHRIAQWVSALRLYNSWKCLVRGDVKIDWLQPPYSSQLQSTSTGKAIHWLQPPYSSQTAVNSCRESYTLAAAPIQQPVCSQLMQGKLYIGCSPHTAARLQSTHAGKAIHWLQPPYSSQTAVNSCRESYTLAAAPIQQAAAVNL